VSGVATAGFALALQSGEIAIPAATAGQALALEVNLERYMTAEPPPYTSGVGGRTDRGVKPFIFGDAIRPRITVDGLRSLSLTSARRGSLPQGDPSLGVRQA